MNRKAEAYRATLLTTAWMFMRHGRSERAKPIVEALVEDNPRDGVAAAALAKILLAEGDADRALGVLRLADFSSDLAHAAAVMETRALRELGRKREAEARWRRYVESSKGADRKWVK